MKNDRGTKERRRVKRIWKRENGEKEDRNEERKTRNVKKQN